MQPPYDAGGNVHRRAGIPFPVEKSDEKFLEIATQLCENRMVSSVYLIGEEFSQEWMKESLRYLCRGRRVFQGNNLFSKGACYSMMERLHPSENGQNHVYLGQDKLKSNIGMKVRRQGEESYQALLDAGINWYEAQNTMEFYLLEGRAVEILITSLTGKGAAGSPESCRKNCRKESPDCGFRWR